LNSRPTLLLATIAAYSHLSSDKWVNADAIVPAPFQRVTDLEKPFKRFQKTINLLDTQLNQDVNENRFEAMV
jgi:hypothetical protein